MPVLTKLPSRHPVVEHRRTPLTEEQKVIQIQHDLFTVERGERFALPFDHVGRKNEFLHRELWKNDANGTYRPGTRFKPFHMGFQKKALAWGRDHIHKEIPFWYYTAVLGHDLHISTFANLYASHFHSGWADPITGEVSKPIDPTFKTLFSTHWVDHKCDIFDAEGRPNCPRDSGVTLAMLQGLGGFVENCGLLSSGKVTTAFVSEEIQELFDATGSEYADFDFHEVGTSSAAEANTEVALVATSGIARVDGTPTNADPIYREVGTITADVTETWEEHGLFNNSTSVAMMDRTLTLGQSVNNTDQVQYTYELTKSAEA